MKNKKLHYLAILVNVDSSILKLNRCLEHGFEVEEYDIFDDECKIVQQIERLKDNAGLWNKLHEFSCVSDNNKVYLVKNSFDVKVHENIENGFVINHDFKNQEDRILINDYVSSFFRKLRLLKEGNPHTCIEYHYFEIKDGFQIALRRKWNDSEIGSFSITKSELNDWNEALTQVKVPISFDKDFLKLSFDNFELSYYALNYNLQFLLLMMCLEVLFKSGNKNIGHKLSKNVASFCANNESSFKKAYFEIRKFYNIRSEIVHEGSYKTKTDDIKKSIKSLRKYVGDSILNIEKLDVNKEEFIILVHTKFDKEFSNIVNLEQLKKSYHNSK